MAATTLVTFLLGHMHGVGSVDLVGSWDNFSAKYPMSKDKQKGHGHWFGTHFMKNIVCDGNPSQPVDERDGGLKMGGLYWYYYIRDGHTEFHNPAEASTNNCPLLPGQTVNVLEIPIEPRLYSIRTSSELSLPLTMNPGDRFITPRPRVRAKESFASIRSSHSRASSKRKRSSNLSRSGSAASQGRPKLQAVEESLRQDWFSQSLGRLQTAVVDACLSLYAGHDNATELRCDRKLYKVRRPMTAVEALPIAANSSKKPSQPRHSSSRPNSRFGLGLRISGISHGQDQVNATEFVNPFSGAASRPSRPVSELVPRCTENLLEGSGRPVTWACSIDHTTDPVWPCSALEEVLVEQRKAATAPGISNTIELGHCQKISPVPIDSSPPANSTGNREEQSPALSQDLSAQTPTLDVLEPRGSCQLPPLSATGSIDWQDVPRMERNSTFDSTASFWTPAASSPSTNYDDWIPPLANKPVLESPVSTLSQGWYTPPSDVDVREGKSIEHNDIVARLKTKLKRRSLGAGDFFDSQETIKAAGAISESLLLKSSTNSASSFSEMPAKDSAESGLPTIMQQDMSDLSYLSAAIN
ncbi:MAG: hypothetical protein M1828_005086 [Chrysothrix sp. TS-e1954]|nr:MAG: hypothetical protein M1828_005086 [Chrysothrix sp. TS-e1954]